MRVVGAGRPGCHGLPTGYPAAAAIIFPVIAASGPLLAAGWIVLAFFASHIWLPLTWSQHAENSTASDSL